MLNQGGYNANLMVGDQCYPAFELRNILDFVTQHLGHSQTELICEQIGVGLVELAASSFVYVWQVDYAMEALRKQTSAVMGAKLGASYQVHSLDILLPHLGQFATLGDCLQFAMKNPALVGSFTDTIVRVENDKLWVRWLNTGKSDTEKYAFQFQHSVCSLVGLARQLAGSTIALDTINLAMPSIDESDDFLSVFTQANVVYEKAYFEWSIKLEMLSVPITYAFDLASPISDSVQNQSIIENVLIRLRDSMPFPPSLDGMAELLHMSSRTLRRKLAASGSSYQKLINQVRCQSAIKMILADDIPLADIAETLGYGDISHFRQSFKHWLGHPPGYFLRQHKGE